MSERRCQVARCDGANTFRFFLSSLCEKVEGLKGFGKGRGGDTFFFSSLRHSLSLTGLGTGRGRGLLAGR